MPVYEYECTRCKKTAASIEALDTNTIYIRCCENDGDLGTTAYLRIMYPDASVSIIGKGLTPRFKTKG